MSAPPHWHAYIATNPPGRGCLAFFVRGPRFSSRQAADQWARRREPDPARRIVRRCIFQPADCPRPEKPP